MLLLFVLLDFFGYATSIEVDRRLSQWIGDIRQQRSIQQSSIPQAVADWCRTGYNYDDPEYRVRNRCVKDEDNRDNRYISYHTYGCEVCASSDGLRSACFNSTFSSDLHYDRVSDTVELLRETECYEYEGTVFCFEIHYDLFDNSEFFLSINGQRCSSLETEISTMNCQYSDLVTYDCTNIVPGAMLNECDGSGFVGLFAPFQSIIASFDDSHVFQPGKCYNNPIDIVPPINEPSVDEDDCVRRIESTDFVEFDNEYKINFDRAYELASWEEDCTQLSSTSVQCELDIGAVANNARVASNCEAINGNAYQYSFSMSCSEEIEPGLRYELSGDILNVVTCIPKSCKMDGGMLPQGSATMIEDIANNVFKQQAVEDTSSTFQCSLDILGGFKQIGGRTRDPTLSSQFIQQSNTNPTFQSRIISYSTSAIVVSLILSFM